MKKKSARPAKKSERKQKAVPFDPKDPRQLKLLLTPGDELERASKEERR
jgi:hypothetical protein